MNETFDLAAKWLSLAREDLDAAEVIYERRPASAWIVCFHAQQAVEKSLKALLIHEQTEFPKTHNIGRLVSLLSADMMGRFDSDVIAGLTVYATDSRYPGDLPDVDSEEAEVVLEIARRAVDQAALVLEHIVTEMLKENP